MRKPPTFGEDGEVCDLSIRLLVNLKQHPSAAASEQSCFKLLSSLSLYKSLPHLERDEQGKENNWGTFASCLETKSLFKNVLFYQQWDLKTAQKYHFIQTPEQLSKRSTFTVAAGYPLFIPSMNSFIFKLYCIFWLKKKKIADAHELSLTKRKDLKFNTAI